MSATAFLEQYLKSLEKWSMEAQQKSARIRDLEQLCQSVEQAIDEMRMQYIKAAITGKLTETVQEDHDEKIRSLFAKASEYEVEKIQLAAETCAITRHHVDQLASLSLCQVPANNVMEIGLRNSSVNVSSPSPPLLSPQRVATPPQSVQMAINNPGSTRNKTKIDVAAATRAPQKRNSNAMLAKNDAAPASSTSTSPWNSTPRKSERIQIAAAKRDNSSSTKGTPKKATNCICSRKRHGKMIGCDNPKCEIGWFHFICMSLSSAPKGKWYCSEECRPATRGNISE